MPDTPRLNAEFEEKLARVLQRMKEEGYPVQVISAGRSAEKQASLYAQGRTKPGKIVTNADGMTKPSRHQLGEAADLAFTVRGRPSHDENLPWDLLGRIAVDEGLTWGGNWTTFVDRPHVQLRQPPEWQGPVQPGTGLPPPRQVAPTPTPAPTPPPARLAPMTARGYTDPSSVRVTEPPAPAPPRPAPMTARGYTDAARLIEPPAPTPVRPAPMTARGYTDAASARVTEPPPAPVPTARPAPMTARGYTDAASARLTEPPEPPAPTPARPAPMTARGYTDQAPAPAPAPAPVPPRRTADGVTAEWNGQNWIAVDDTTAPPALEERPRRTADGVTAEWDGQNWIALGEPSSGEPPPKEAKSIPGFIRNSFESGGRLVSDVATGIGGAATLLGRVNQARFSPEESRKLGEDIYGFLQQTPAIASALFQTYKHKYSPDNILDTLYEDPFGVAADVASVAGGAGAALKATPLVKTAQAFSRAAELADPIRAAAKVGGAVGSRVAKTGLALRLPEVPGGATGFRGRYNQAGDIIESGVYGSRSARNYAGRMDDLADITIGAADRDPTLGRITGQTLVQSAEGEPMRVAQQRVRGGAAPASTTDVVQGWRDRLDRTHIDPRLDRTTEGIKARFPKAGDDVGGRGVRGNTKGVREVRMSEMDPTAVVPPPGTQLDDVLDLADRIDERGKVKPLELVLEEGPHPRVDRGRVRYGALETLGQDAFPARVTVDPTKLPPDPYKKLSFDESRRIRNQARTDAPLSSGANRDVLEAQGRDVDTALRTKLPVFALAEDRSKMYQGIGDAFAKSKSRIGRDVSLGGLAATVGANPVAAVGGALAKAAVQSPRTYAVGGIVAKKLSRLMSDPKMRAIILALRAKGISDEVIEATLSREGGQ